MKKIALALFSVIFFSTQAVFAQSYMYVQPYSGSLFTNAGSMCVSVARDLSIGSRGNDVRTLQTFLARRGYPGGGSWMITGYFGAATRAAVINFQSDLRLPQTGRVDIQTRNALANMSCQNVGNVVPNPYSWNSAIPVPNYPNTYVPPMNYPPVYTNQCGIGYFGNCPTNGAIGISYLSPSSGAIGAYVTVFGNGFTPTGNTVRFGNGIIANLNSSDGKTVSFTVPATLTGYGTQAVYLTTYNVSVSNSYGATSNTLPFVVTSLGSAGAPTISNLTGPNTLAVQTTGTWTVYLNNPSNSNYTSVSVNWGDTVYGASSQPSQPVYGGSQTLTFTHSYAQTGTYTVTVTATNASGQSNSATATVNVSGTSYGTAILTYLSPTSGRVGTQVQLVGTNFSATDNTVRFGNGGTLHLPSQNGTVIYYTIPAYISACDLIGSPCGAPAQLVTSGSYQISVTTANGTTNQLTFNVL